MAQLFSPDGISLPGLLVHVFAGNDMIHGECQQVVQCLDFFLVLHELLMMPGVQGRPGGQLVMECVLAVDGHSPIDGSGQLDSQRTHICRSSDDRGFVNRIMGDDEGLVANLEQFVGIEFQHDDSSPFRLVYSSAASSTGSASASMGILASLVKSASSSSEISWSSRNMRMPPSVSSRQQ